MKRTFSTAIVVAAALGLAACGSDAESADTVAADTAATPETEAAADESVSATASEATSGAAEAFPVTIEHVYGETTIEARPERIVSIGYGEHEYLLALGVAPVGVREWWGEYPYATWPWAQDELGDAQPEVIVGDLNFEQIAALEPDLIVGMYSGITDTDYSRLAAIAPTIARPAEFADYGTPMDARLRTIGAALGVPDQAEILIADVADLFAQAAAEHPEFAGRTASIASLWDHNIGVYTSIDPRSRALVDLGFVVPEAIDDLAPEGEFYAELSAEDLSSIDTDALVWFGDGDYYLLIRDLPTRPATRAYQEGREVLADDLLTGAFSHASPLSWEYVIDTLVPELALAVDGDAATPVPSAAAIAPEGTDAGQADTGAAEAAAGDAWSLVFDSTVTYDEKAMHVADAEALRATIEAYTAAGETMGGISLTPTEVLVSGASATVTYDVLFGGTAAYEDLTGVLALVDGTWVVSREEFCSFMASARNSCPAG